MTADLGQSVWSNLTIQGLIQQDAQAIMLIGDLAYAVSLMSSRLAVSPDRPALLCFNTLHVLLSVSQRCFVWETVTLHRSWTDPTQGMASHTWPCGMRRLWLLSCNCLVLVVHGLSHQC